MQISVEIPHAQFLAMVDVPVVVQRQVLWSKQCRTLFGSSQLQFLDKVVDTLVIVQRQVLGETEQKNVEVHSCSFVEVVQFLDRLLTRPLVCNVMRVVQTVQKTVVFLQLQLSDGFVPGDPGSFQALDDEVPGCGADAGSFTPRC